MAKKAKAKFARDMWAIVGPDGEFVCWALGYASGTPYLYGSRAQARDNKDSGERVVRVRVTTTLL